MSSNLVSIIIPCFNAEEYIRETIESCLNQSHGQVEVIVVDDGSKDGSLDVLSEFGKAIRWERQENAGACVARNRGFALARGDWIQFLDADDLLDEKKLERQLPFAQQNLETLTYTDGRYLGNGQAHPHHARTDTSDDALIFMLRGGLPTPAPLHRREWVCKVEVFGLGCDVRKSGTFTSGWPLQNAFSKVAETLYYVRLFLVALVPMEQRCYCNILRSFAICSRCSRRDLAMDTQTRSDTYCREVSALLMDDARRLHRMRRTRERQRNSRLPTKCPSERQTTWKFMATFTEATIRLQSLFCDRSVLSAISSGKVVEGQGLGRSKPFRNWPLHQGGDLVGFTTKFA